ncbi:MAG TPA: hypothetical protein DEA08_06905, partial [Planctomycetes bacterium]|nr:hypothetical protein [Planctomycetota bacterium]
MPDPDAWLESVCFPELEPELDELDDEGALAAVELEFDIDLWREASARYGQRLQRESKRSSQRASARQLSSETQRVSSGPERVFPSGDTARLGSRRTRRLPPREDTRRLSPPREPAADPRASA